MGSRMVELYRRIYQLPPAQTLFVAFLSSSRLTLSMVLKAFWESSLASLFQTNLPCHFHSQTPSQWEPFAVAEMIHLCYPALARQVFTLLGTPFHTLPCCLHLFNREHCLSF